MKKILAGFAVGLVIGIGTPLAMAHVPDGYVDLSDIDTDELLELCEEAVRNDDARLVLPEQK